MRSSAVKKVLLAGLNGKAVQWSSNNGDGWEDDKTIADMIASAHYALDSEYFKIRIKPKKLTGEPHEG